MAATSLLILIAVALALALLPRLRAPSAPREPKVERYDSAPTADPAAGAGIPKLIWSYWHTAEQPEVVQRCLRNWALHNPDYEIRLVNGENLWDYVPRETVPPAFFKVTPARQSDWLRLYFLQRYGGVWLDASIILTRSLEWMRQAQAREQSDYVGFYLERYTRNPQRPVMDSWCMAAPAGSRFARDWFKEFSDRATQQGDQAYLDELQASGQAAAVLQGIPSPAYMLIHVTGQRVLQRGGAYRLHLMRAEDSAYFYHHRRWKRLGLFLSLLILREAQQPSALIKLRGGERRKLEPYLARRVFTRHSLAARHLMLP